MSSTPESGSPDPMRSHGAWVVLSASVGAGALASEDRGVVQGLVVGTVFAGGFLATAALVAGRRHKLRQGLTGAGLGVASLALALAAGAERSFLWPVGAAALMALGTTVALDLRGFLSRPALVLGLGALTLAAPASALAGGANLPRAALLFLALWLFSCWRSLSIAATLRGPTRWDRVLLRRRGLHEAGYMALWSLIVTLASRCG